MADRENRQDGSAFGQQQQRQPPPPAAATAAAAEAADAAAPPAATTDIHVTLPQREHSLAGAEADLGLQKLSDYERQVSEQQIQARQAVEDMAADADKKGYGGDLDDDLSEDAANECDRDEDGNAMPLKKKTCWTRFSRRAGLIVGSIIPAGGLLASGMNIAGSTIGGGILGLPAGANQTGLVLAYIYIVLMVILNVMSMRMLAFTAQKTGIRSFEAMARYLLPQGNYAFSYWMAFVRWFNSMGSCIAYVISVGNSFKPIFDGALEKFPGNPGYEYFTTGNGLKVLTVIVFFLIMVPLILPRHVDSLRHVAFVAILFMLYFCIIVVVHSCTHGLKVNKHNVHLSNHYGRGDEAGKIYLFRTGNPCLEALGTFVFAFVCQVNAVEVYWDMSDHLRNPNGYTAAAALAIGLCAVIYVFVFTFGYFDFGAEALGSNSILLMYNPMKEPEVMLAYVGVLIKLCVAFALQFMAARNAAYYAIGFTQRYAKKKGKKMAIQGIHHHGKKDKKKSKNSSGSSSLKKEEQQENSDEMSEMEDAQELGLQEARQHPQELQRPEKEGQEPAPAAGGLSMDQSYIDNIPIQWHLLVVGILAAICLILGLFIPNINVVFNFAGSICGSFLEFITPALFIIYSGGFTIKKVGCFMWVMAHFSLVVGVITLVYGTGATIYGLAGGK